MNATPKVDIPSAPQMPEQNAFDIYVAAGKVLTQHIVIGYAAEGIMPTALPNGDLLGDPRPCTSTDRLSILAANSISLNLFYQGRKLQYQEPAYNSTSATMPYYSNFRRLTGLLIIQGREYEARRDWKRAAEQYLRALEFGATISDHATILMGWQVGQQIEWIGRDALWQIENKLDSEMLSQALARLKQREAVRPGLDQIFLQESRFNQAGFLETFQERDWVRLVSYDFEGDVAFTSWSKYARLQTMGKRGFFDDYVRAMNAVQRDTLLLYTKRRPPNDPNSITFGFQPDFPRFYFSDTRHRAGHSLLTTEIALRLYRLDRGRYPSQLKQLIPQYLKSVPTDPFGAGEPLCYELSSAEYSLYSIGPDGIDNQGRAIEKHRNDERSRNIVSLESKGDFVAGINH